MSTHHQCRANCGGTDCPVPVRHLSARELHDAHLDSNSGFHRVITGNAFEGHQRPRRRRLGWWRAFVAFLLAPSPWERTR